MATGNRRREGLRTADGMAAKKLHQKLGLKLPLVKINRKTRELILSGSTELFETKQVGWWQRLPNNRFLGL